MSTSEKSGEPEAGGTPQQPSPLRALVDQVKSKLRRQPGRIRALVDQVRSRLRPQPPSRIRGRADPTKAKPSGRRAAQQKEAAQDRLARRLVVATAATACLALAILGVGVLQHVAVEDQLSLVRGQLDALRGQLDEARSEHLATIAQVRAVLRQDDFTTDSTVVGDENGWLISPHWTNTGATAADHIRGSWNIRWTPSHGAAVSELECPAPPAVSGSSETGPLAAGGPLAEQGKFLPLAVAQAALSHQTDVLIAGHIEWRDAFPGTPVHHFDWCSQVVPTDLAKPDFSFFPVYSRGD